MPVTEGQPGLEPVNPGYYPGTPFTQADYSIPQSLYTVQASKAPGPEDSFPEALPDGSLEPVYPGYHPGDPFTHPDHSSLQSWPKGQSEKTDNFATPSTGTPQHTPTSGTSLAAELENTDKTRISSHRKKWLIWGGVAAVLCVILVAVLVGVFVAKASDKQSKTAAMGTTSPTTANSTSSNSSTSSIVALNQIRQGSDMTVAGWRTDDGIQIFLYYQDINGTLRYSEYDSGRGSFTTNNSYWEDSETLMTVAENTSVAAGMIVWQSTDAPQIELYYINSTEDLSGLSINDYLYPNTGFADDSINNKSVVTTTDSALASYWPYVAVIDDTGVLSVVGNVPESDDFSPESNWTVTSMGVNPMAGSKLSMVPLGITMASIEAGGYGIFYQDSNGDLAKYQPILTESWPTDAVFPSINLPDGGSFAAFTTARPDDDKDRVNTYVLYQEESLRISMVYLDNDSTWTVTQPSALGDADNGTGIACLTMPISEEGTDSEALELEIASNEVARCYFQRGGLVREVVLSGTDWVETGSIPLS